MGYMDVSRARQADAAGRLGRGDIDSRQHGQLNEIGLRLEAAVTRFSDAVRAAYADPLLSSAGRVNAIEKAEQAARTAIGKIRPEVEQLGEQAQTFATSTAPRMVELKPGVYTLRQDEPPTPLQLAQYGYWWTRFDREDPITLKSRYLQECAKATDQRDVTFMKALESYPGRVLDPSTTEAAAARLVESAGLSGEVAALRWLAGAASHLLEAAIREVDSVAGVPAA